MSSFLAITHQKFTYLLYQIPSPTSKFLVFSRYPLLYHFIYLPLQKSLITTSKTMLSEIQNKYSGDFINTLKLITFHLLENIYYFIPKVDLSKPDKLLHIKRKSPLYKPEFLSSSKQPRNSNQNLTNLVHRLCWPIRPQDPVILASPRKINSKFYVTLTFYRNCQSIICYAERPKSKNFHLQNNF